MNKQHKKGEIQMHKVVKHVGVVTLMVTGLWVGQPGIQVAHSQGDIKFEQGNIGERDDEGVIQAVLSQSSKLDELGLFPSVIMAQALYESGYGRSLYATELNNIFGLRDELGFAHYNTQGEGVGAYLDLLTNRHYSQYKLGEQLTVDEQIDALVQAGWSPLGKEYGVKLTNIIEHYDLTQYDK